MKALHRVAAEDRPFVPHTRPCLGPEEAAAALRVLRSGRLAPGPEAARLESLVTRMTGGSAAVALSSGTTALSLALRALGIGPGDDVAIPSYSCAALLHAVHAASARPLICDVDPATLCLDPGDLRRRATPRLRAVVFVHPFGEAGPAEDLRLDDLALIEDCAQSPGARRDGSPVGATGDAAIVSFGPTKLLTCGGPGGALASRHPRVVSRARDLAGHDEKDDNQVRVNGLMGDLHAAIASVQVGRLGEFVARRREIALRYDVAFAHLPWERPPADPTAQPVFYRYLLRIPRGADDLLAALNERGIMARRPVWRPLHHLMPEAGPCPGADAAHAQWISLPLSADLRESEQALVISAVLACRS